MTEQRVPRVESVSFFDDGSVMTINFTDNPFYPTLPEIARLFPAVKHIAPNVPPTAIDRGAPNPLRDQPILTDEPR